MSRAVETERTDQGERRLPRCGEIGGVVFLHEDSQSLLSAPVTVSQLMKLLMSTVARRVTIKTKRNFLQTIDDERTPQILLPAVTNHFPLTTSAGGGESQTGINASASCFQQLFQLARHAKGTAINCESRHRTRIRLTCDDTGLPDEHTYLHT